MLGLSNIATDMNSALERGDTAAAVNYKLTLDEKIPTFALDFAVEPEVFLFIDFYYFFFFILTFMIGT